MRKGRFAGLSDRGQEPVTPPGLAELLLFDFAPADGEDDDRAARERARTIQLSLPLLMGSHLLWTAVLIFSLASLGAGDLVGPVAILLGTILLLDGLLWFALERAPLKPYQAMRLTAVHGVAMGTLWVVAAHVAAGGPAAQSVVVKAALIAGAGAAIPVFFTIPLLMGLASAATLAVAALVPSDEPLLPIGAGIGFLLAWLCVSRSRHLLFTARQHLAVEWQAEKARRFVADFEASGRGWFWETNADGALTYVSDPLAAHLGLAAADLIGRRFEDVLLLDCAEEEEGDSRRTLGFHLSARFPFADVVVRARPPTTSGGRFPAAPISTNMAASSASAASAATSASSAEARPRRRSAPATTASPTCPTER
jgi:PAS domain-containing protein